MNIGIVGAGNVGTGLAKRLIARGHGVMLSFSRSDDALRNTAAALNARAGTPSEATRFGDAVILSSKWADTAEAIRQIGSIAETKVLWDCTNPMKPDMSGLLIGTTTSGGEEVAKLAPGERSLRRSLLSPSNSTRQADSPAKFVRRSLFAVTMRTQERRSRSW